jgi:hypothetical protein
MRRQDLETHRRIALGAVGMLAMLCSSSEVVLAAATGDGRMGPKVVSGEVVDQSLYALNRHIQDKYALDDMLAALTAPRAPDFAVAATASAAAPTIEETPEVGAFGYRIFDDSSLNNGLELFNTEVALRGTDLFIQVAMEATSKGEAFALAVRGAGLDEKMARYRQEMAEVTEGFGNPVRDSSTLETSIVALNERIGDQVVREIRLAAAVPPTDGTSFLNYAVAMAYSY